MERAKARSTVKAKVNPGKQIHTKDETKSRSKNEPRSQGQSDKQLQTRTKGLGSSNRPVSQATCGQQVACIYSGE